jgi:hypothetical protein
VRELFTRGADVNAAMNDGATSLYIASQEGHNAIVRELLTRGADVNVAMNDGRTSLHIARVYGHAEVVRELLAHGALETITPRAERVNAFHVHKEFDKFKSKIPSIIKIIKEDIGKDKKYSDFGGFLDNSIGKYIETSPEFEEKQVNSEEVVNKNKKSYKPKTLKRKQWIADYNKLKGRLVHAEHHHKIQIGNIIDFVSKHHLKECFISGFLYDCAHAYEGNASHDQMSCHAGIIERSMSTFFNCIKGKDDGVFKKLNDIIDDDVKTWAELDKSKQAAYIKAWNKFLFEWSRNKAENNSVKGMKPEERSDAAMEAFKIEEHVPNYVEEHIRSEIFPGLKNAWEDYGFNSSGGGRKKTRKVIKVIKVRKTRKN